MRIVALIPARAGSKRVPGKNTRLLGGKPLIQWTIEAAINSGAFRAIAVCSDVPDILNPVPLGFASQTSLVPRRPVSDDQPDIVWVRDALEVMGDFDAFAIVRPTSPFRTGHTIARAVARLTKSCDSVRAVQPVRETPYKMWAVADDRLWPLLTGALPNGTPYHSSPTQSLPPVCIQNSSLELAWTRTVRDTGTIAGHIVRPFFTEGWEGFSIDYPDDWDRAEAHAQEIASLARV